MLSAFTLAELLAVIAVLALVLLILAPSLHAARGLSKSEVCLSNLHSLGVAVRMYAEEHSDVLPGPLYSAVHHDQTLQTYVDLGYSQEYALYLLRRQLMWLLRSVLGDEITDRACTCPVMGDIVPDRHFQNFSVSTGIGVFPTHYGLNNHGSNGNDGGPVGNIRGTAPPYYFGRPAGLLPIPPPVSPVRIGAVPNASLEWMIADAWYRSRVNTGFPELQQEGPYQWSWYGEALPYFAPHLKRGSTTVFLDSCQRQIAAAGARSSKSDGVTNTLFFDGHAASVPSRTGKCYDWELLYGFPGTVNPHTPLPDCLVWE